ncbi:hypothetical protein EJB05_31130, partial [Eragrostis curvula]
MVPVTSTVVLGQTPSQQPGWRVWARRALILFLFLAVTGGFAVAAHGARHRPRELVYAVVVYFLLVLLLCCFVKLEQLRRDPAAAAGERRRMRVAVWVVSVTLSNTFASCVADLMPVLVLKLEVWAVAAVVLGIAFYHLFCSKDEVGCCNVEHGRGQADDDAGRRPGSALHDLSPEEKLGLGELGRKSTSSGFRRCRRLRPMLGARRVCSPALLDITDDAAAAPTLWLLSPSVMPRENGKASDLDKDG